MGETQNQANEIMGDPRDSEIRDRTIKKHPRKKTANSIIILAPIPS